MRYCFYSGYKDLKGGYTTLLITLIKELYKQNVRVLLINYSDGLIANELKLKNIDIEILDIDSIDWNKVDNFIYPTDIFIITKFNEVYRNLFKINPLVIYYDINDFICAISDYKFGIRLQFVGKKLIKKLLSSNSLIFMDDTGPENLKRNMRLLIEDPVYLPIPIASHSFNIYKENMKTEKNVLRFTYIGRSVKWKMTPLVKVLDDCLATNTDFKIEVKVLVDNKEELRKYINLDKYQKASHLTIEIIENLQPSEINNFLIKNSDLHFAMGTAALDAAGIGIPTILVDYSNKSFPLDYGYKWLFETRNYSLGYNLENKLTNGRITMPGLINTFQYNISEVCNISDKNYNYVLENHSVEKIVAKLLKVSRTASFRIKDARTLIPYYYNIHSILKIFSKLFFRNQSVT